MWKFVNKNYKRMKEKERYFSPISEVIFTALEGVVCASEVDPEGVTIVFDNPFPGTEIWL